MKVYVLRIRVKYSALNATWVHVWMNHYMVRDTSLYVINRMCVIDECMYIAAPSSSCLHLWIDHCVIRHV